MESLWPKRPQGAGVLVLQRWFRKAYRRIRMNRATEAYSWICAAPNSGQTLDLGRILWAGAEADVGRILDDSQPNKDPDGPAWIGLLLEPDAAEFWLGDAIKNAILSFQSFYHPRLS